ncbi:MAG: restriction endonuclease subunit S, partial [Alistipes sp.]|nr:restriction endonuclease subunit S [Alistipes sp.]
MRAMKDSGVDWIGEIPIQWQLVPTKRVFKGKKQIAGANSEMYERLALTMNGVVKRNKDDNEGLQPEQFDSYQILESNELVFKLIDLQNIRTSRVGLSPYTGIVSPAYIILTNTKSDNRFYYYWYFDMYNRCVFNRMGGDGVRSALNLKDVLEIPIPMISDAEQQRIAEFLDRKCAEVDEMIALQEQIIEELKAYKQSVITEAVTKGLNPTAP